MITREEWIGNRSHCHRCEKMWYQLQCSLETHEIVTRACNAKSPRELSTLLRLCGECHCDIHDYSKWPIARQLALKKRQDPEHYDRQRVNVLRGRAPDAITEEEVDSYMEGLLCTQTETNSKRKSQS